LVSVRMIRAAGNVDDRRFPHYIADYEFFSRLRQHGFKLVVTYETRIAAHIEETGITPSSREHTAREMWKLLFSRRSMTNVVDHWRFIGRCAPPELRATTRLRLIRVSIGMVLLQTKLRYLLVRVDPLWHAVWFGARGSYYVSERDCLACHVDAAALVREGILRPWLREGWYVFAVRRATWWASRKDLRPLWIRAWNPLRKPLKWIAARRYRAALSKAAAERGSTSP